ncbi:MAG: DNA polymerase III subunit beta [Synergistaceae bacterium]|jgi:DNA polymerase-3 subunit beta|nr:DNA polymerase III subunit beta [Synergistaceae bacterium]
MKISVNKEIFLKSWGLAERGAGASGAMNIYSTVRMRADMDEVELQATDIRTSVICKAGGVTVIEPGEAVIPIKGVSDLFKKAGASDFMIQIDGGQAVMTSGKSRYKFATYPTGDFPKLPASSGAGFFCSMPVSALISAIEKGTLCASSGDEYPQYLSSAYFEMAQGVLNIVSTDKRRLALCKAEVTEGSESDPMLLPMKGLKELQRVLGMIDSGQEMKISCDDAQAYFIAEGVELAVRKVETKFPAYAKILPTSHKTSADIDKSSLISAIERVDVVVRDYNKTVLVNLDLNGECTLSGIAQEFGEAVEHIQCNVEGEPVFIGFNTRFFYDAVKALDGPMARLVFNGSEGHMVVRLANSDNFLCLVAPVELSKEEMEARDISDGGVDVL